MDPSGYVHHDMIGLRDWAALRGMLNSEDSSERFASTNFHVSGNGEELSEIYYFNAMHMICWEQETPPVDVLTKLVEIDEKNLSRKTIGPSKATPLHLICHNSLHFMSGFVKTFLALKPDAAIQLVSEKDERGMTPLDVAWLRAIDPGYLNYDNDFSDYGQGDLLIIEASAKFSNPDDDSPEGDVSGRAESRVVQNIWDITKHILFAATTCAKTETPSTWIVVHSIASTEIMCPNIAMRFALALHPEQARWQDKDGNFPLHMAASCRNHYRYPILPSGAERDSNLVSLLDHWDDDEVSERAKATMDEIQTSPVRVLVEIYPQAASIANNDGQYPIHLSAERGADWADDVEPIFSAAPRTLNKRDPKTGLLPFMLAAVDIDLVYRLLRANPANVKGGIRNSRYEEYLEKKLAEKGRHYCRSALQEA